MKSKQQWFLQGIQGVNRRQLGTELLAGITLAALAIPLNIGYAQIAGLPPIVGLYTAIIPVGIFAIFSSSRQLVASPDAPIAALIASLLVAVLPASDTNYVQLAYAQTLVCAVVFFIFYAFRLGFLANFLSEPVLVGFIAGLAIEILTSQVKKILGISVDDDRYFVELWKIVTGVLHSHWWSVVVGVGTIAVILVFRKLLPALPASLLALVGAIALVMLFNLGERGVSVLGKVPSGLPSLTWPEIILQQWISLVPGAIAICAVTLADGLLTARKYSEAHGYPIDANRELFAFGAANVASGFTGGFAVGSSASRTAAMDASGSRSQIPSLVSMGIVALVVGTMSGLLAELPNPALAAVVAVAVAVVKLIDVGKLRDLYQLRRSEFLIAITCMIGVPVLGSLTAVILAFLLSAVDFLRRAASPDTARLASGSAGRFSRAAEGKATATAGIIIYRFGAPLFFANATTFNSEVKEALKQLGEGDWFVVDAEAINDIDTTGAAALRRVINQAHSARISFGIARAHAHTRWLLRHYALADLIGEDHIFESNEAAFSAYKTEHHLTA